MLEINNSDSKTLTLPAENLDLLLKQENPGDLIGMYLFYCYAAKCQGTNEPYCTLDQVIEGLDWNPKRIYQAKKQLKDLNFVRDVQIRRNGGSIIGHRIKLLSFS